MGRIGQLAIAGKLTAGSSPNGAIVSSVMQRPRWTAHSSFCSSKIAPTDHGVEQDVQADSEDSKLLP
jgi:hypothetical protein